MTATRQQMPAKPAPAYVAGQESNRGQTQVLKESKGARVEMFANEERS